jgi:hypothetical protein
LTPHYNPCCGILSTMFINEDLSAYCGGGSSASNCTTVIAIFYHIKFLWIFPGAIEQGVRKPEQNEAIIDYDWIPISWPGTTSFPSPIDSCPKRQSILRSIPGRIHQAPHENTNTDAAIPMLIPEHPFITITHGKKIDTGKKFRGEAGSLARK